MARILGTNESGESFALDADGYWTLPALAHNYEPADAVRIVGILNANYRHLDAGERILAEVESPNA